LIDGDHAIPLNSKQSCEIIWLHLARPPVLDKQEVTALGALISNRSTSKAANLTGPPWGPVIPLGDDLPPNGIGAPAGAADCAFASLTRSISTGSFMP
jgi:hypothetical protein